jgi:tight adherence protein C
MSLLIPMALGAGVTATLILLSPAVIDPTWRSIYQKSGFLQGREDDAVRRSPALKLVLPLARYLGWIARCFGFPRHRDEVMRQLALANYPGGFLPEEFMGMTVVVAVSAACMSQLVIGGITGVLEFHPFFFLLTFVVMLFYPWVWLQDEVNRIQSRIVRVLPNVLDIIALGLDAGLEFNVALRRLVDSSLSSREPIVDDFRFMLEQLEIGKPRGEVFDEVRRRYQTGPIATLMTAFIQVDRYGTPLVSILRVQAATLRTHRSQLAQKAANEAPVKILFPLVFIFGAVVLTMFGSIIIKVLEGRLFDL